MSEINFLIMNKRFLIQSISVFIFAISFAGQSSLNYNSQSSNITIEQNFDSLLNNFYVKKAYDQYYEVSSATDTSIPEFHDSVYISRLKKIPSAIPLTYNNIVRNFIHVYTIKKRDKLSAILSLKEYYFPMIEKIMDLHGLPKELKYMAVIESALNATVISRAGAVGLWQFMYPTGKMYGLKMNSYIDERRDPVRATHAAAEYLKDLYNIYNDWILVIAAYNCGPGNVNKAIRRRGGKADYWDIYYYLPRETRGYVPAFVAATYSMNYFETHNVKPTKIEMPPVTDTIVINQNLHFDQIEAVLNISKSKLRSLNPQYRADIIPGDYENAHLRLPFDLSPKFISLKDSIFSYKDSIYDLNKNMLKSPTSYSAYKPSAPKGNYTKLYYTVKKGDAVGLIADWYDIRTADLRYWNNIRRNIIRTGQKLVIYKPKSIAHNYKNINSMSFKQKQNKEGYTIKSQPEEEIKIDPNSYFYYTVKKGDSLWEIAKKYNGVTQKSIIKINKFSYNTKIYPGQKIKIPE